MSAVTVSPDIQDSPQIVRLIARAVEAGEIAMSEVRDAAEVAEVEPDEIRRRLADAGVEILPDPAEASASRDFDFDLAIAPSPRAGPVKSMVRRGPGRVLLGG